MGNPQEIIIAPFEVYVAPVGTAFPAINVVVPGTWLRMGIQDMQDKGVTVTHSQTITEWSGVGGTGPRAVARTKEGLEIMFELVDLTLEKYAYALNGAALTIVNAGVGIPGTKDLALYQGASVNTFALLARGPSPYLSGVYMQFQVPVVYQKDQPKPVFTKTAPAGLQLTFAAMEDPNASVASERFGDLIAQTALPT